MTDGSGRHRAKGGTAGPGGPVGRMFATDEELGKLSKKDDDRKLGRVRALGSTWANVPRLKRRKVVYITLGVVVLWLILRYHIAKPVEVSRLQPHDGSQRDYGWHDRAPPTGPPPPPKRQGVLEPEHYYDGGSVFYHLSSALRDIPRAYGFRSMNRHVLFAASSLKSLTQLIPLACEMSLKEQSYVHLAVMGRHELSLEAIKEINGVDVSECKHLHWIDARPDYAMYSTDARAEAAVAAALKHISSYLSSPSLIANDPQIEDAFFVRAVRNSCVELSITLIELPLDAADRVSWMLRLDAAAIAAWHKPTVDILIQAATESTGSLMRLLTSLYAADYSGLEPPRLTIELPPEVDATTQVFLKNYHWPPPTSSPSSRPPGGGSQLILRHRIPNRRMSAEEASVRFFESFYPASTTNNHVLILSPQAQVSPLFLHYLKYHILEYRYSSYASTAQNLMGISLDLPATYLNGTTGFIPPSMESFPATALQRAHPNSPDCKPPFQWQAPNSNAALYFGDSWIELHSFLSHRLTKFHTSNVPQSSKLIAPDRPAWTEYFLEFMRARGLSLLYPGVADNSESNSPALVTIHAERFVPPEEFLHPPSSRQDSGAPSNVNFDTDAEPFTAPATVPSPPPKSPESSTHNPRLTLSQVLPFVDALPELSALPHLSHSGAALTHSTAADEANVYADHFRVSVGGCSAEVPYGKRRKRRRGDARDLFCYGGEEKDEDAWEKDIRIIDEPRSKKHA